MNIYIETGYFVDFFSSRTIPAAYLRMKSRRGRTLHQIQQHAQLIMKKISHHTSYTSIVTIEEYANVSYKHLNQTFKGRYNKSSFIRSTIKTESTKLYTLCRHNNIDLIPLNSSIIHDALTNPSYNKLDFYDAIHISTARSANVGIVISANSDLLSHDNVFDNIRILDTDIVLKYI